VRDVGDEVGLEPRHLGLAPDHAVGRAEPQRDHDQEQREGRREEHRLPPDAADRRDAVGLVEDHAPGGQRLAERHGEDALRPLDGARWVHLVVGAVENGEHARPLEPAQGLGQD